jgi:hypothetical protein
MENSSIPRNSINFLGKYFFDSIIPLKNPLKLSKPKTTIFLSKKSKFKYFEKRMEKWEKYQRKDYAN